MFKWKVNCRMCPSVLFILGIENKISFLISIIYFIKREEKLKEIRKKTISRHWKYSTGQVFVRDLDLLVISSLHLFVLGPLPFHSVSISSSYYYTPNTICFSIYRQPSLRQGSPPLYLSSTLSIFFSLSKLLSSFWIVLMISLNYSIKL